MEIRVPPYKAFVDGVLDGSIIVLRISGGNTRPNREKSLSLCINLVRIWKACDNSRRKLNNKTLIFA
jgi:hypothetical protein